MTTFPKKNGFTLIELLTVIAVIGILAAILISTVARVRASARRANCASNLRQLATASELYSGENRGALIEEPYVVSGVYWFRQLYPYLKGDSINRVSALFQCPDDEAALTAYASGGTEWNSISYLLLKEDSSYRQRLQIATPARSPQFVDAEAPDSADYHSDAKFALRVKGAIPEWRHGNGVNVAYWDGHVSFVTDPTYQTLFHLNTN